MMSVYNASIYLIAFGIAIASVAHGWLGHLAPSRNIATVCSAAWIAIGSSLNRLEKHASILPIGQILNGFGLGILFVISPTYISDSESPVLKTVLVGATALWIGISPTGCVLWGFFLD